MLDWYKLVYLPEAELAELDIAAVNVACASGLPGCEHLDLSLCRSTIEAWAAHCALFTKQVMPMFFTGRCDYPDSEARFRIQAMITHLQRDLGVVFRADKRNNGAVLEPADSFLNGIIQGQGGTCGSLPVLYTAVGRRLGYPLRLATSRNHLYVRWDAPCQECFNIEASGVGVSFFPDEYYRQGPYAMPQDTIDACGHLRSLSPREELASFLGQRGECWMQERVYQEAVTAFAWANELDPERMQHRLLTWQALGVWDQQLRLRLPPRHFPVLDIGLPAQRFQCLPHEWEREIIRMRILQGLLNDPELDERWWSPIRRNPDVPPRGMPARLRVDYRWSDPLVPQHKELEGVLS